MRRVALPFRSPALNVLWWCTGLPAAVLMMWALLWLCALPLYALVAFKRVF